MKDYKVALVHDDLLQYGGAERVLEVMHEIWPDAPIYTSLYDREEMLKKGWNDDGMDIRTSKYQWLPLKAKFGNKFYLPIFPLAFESFDFSEYDLVISSSTRFAHGIITRSETCHISYCNSPARFLWMYSDYEKGHGGIKSWQKLFLAPILHWQRIWDQQASQRPDFFFGNSTTAVARINKFFRRSAEVMFPPADVTDFIPRQKFEKKNYYVIVGRMAGHKRYDIAVEAFNKLGSDYELRLIGSGDKLEELKTIAKDNVKFLGFVSNEEREKQVQEAKGFLYPQLEDFGLTAVEANAAGTPVIAYGKGGALDTIIDGKTGVYFSEQTLDSLVDAIKRFEKMNLNAEDCIENAKRFDKEIFKKKMKERVEEMVREYKSNIIDS